MKLIIRKAGAWQLPETDVEGGHAKATALCSQAIFLYRSAKHKVSILALLVK